MSEPESTPPPFVPYVPGPGQQQTEALPPMGPPTGGFPSASPLQATEAALPFAGAQNYPALVPPRRSRVGLVVAALLGALALMAGTGVGVWLLTRPKATTTPTPAASSAGTVDVSGVIILERGQFVWQSVSDPSCQGMQGFSDIRTGAQVVVTDASGKVLAVGSLDVGTAQGITTESDGMHRASTCTMPFNVPGIPRGVGPYGVEVSHRGVLRYDEGQLSILRLGFN